MKASVRYPAVAGLFYPLDRPELRADVENMLAAAQPVDSNVRPRMLIVPHAGYIYSGPIAATGYRLLSGVAGLHKIVMLGPSHYTAFSGLALPGVDVMETPLGDVAVEPESIARLLGDPLVENLPEAHGREHSLEVQLPFLQVVAPAIPVVPLLTGTVDPAEAATVVEPLLDDRTVLVVSSDLSHYHDAATARRLDADTVAAIERIDPDGIGRRAACGRTGIQIALHIAGRRGYRAQVLDLRNSADTAGGPDRVVGYPAIVLGERQPSV